MGKGRVKVRDKDKGKEQEKGEFLIQGIGLNALFVRYWGNLMIILHRDVEWLKA